MDLRYQVFINHDLAQETGKILQEISAKKEIFG